jgi:molybdopterin converting factor small subunit
MQVQIKLVGVLVGIVGEDELLLELEENGDVAKLVKKFSAKYKDRFEKNQIDPVLWDPRINSIILINGTDAEVLDGIKTKLHNGDLVTIISVSHGG